MSGAFDLTKLDIKHGLSVAYLTYEQFDHMVDEWHCYFRDNGLDEDESNYDSYYELCDAWMKQKLNVDHIEMVGEDDG